MSEDNPQFESQSRCLDPIRQPLVSSHKYQKYIPSATMRQNDSSSCHQIIPQDCSMSSYSSGYDSMTQSPPSSKEGHLSTLSSRNQEASQQQMYSTNYDNVRGHLRGPFVSYTNNKKWMWYKLQFTIYNDNLKINIMSNRIKKNWNYQVI